MMSKVQHSEKTQHHEPGSVANYVKRLVHVTSWTITVLLLVLLVPSMPDGAIDALFIFYQPLLPFLLMLWLWIIVVWFFETHMIRYQACFASDHLEFLLSWTALTRIAAAFTTALGVGVSTFLLLVHNNLMEYASWQPALLFILMLGVIANPLDGIIDSSTKTQRWFFLDTVRRVVLPFQEVFFTDFLLADILTSLAKPLADMGLGACHFMSETPISLSIAKGFDPEVCGSHSLLIPFVLALPYIWRFAQCLIIARDKNDFGQVLNAIKYSTALPVVFLRFVKYSVELETWRAFWKPLWVVACVVNTTYSFYWDVERDWDIRLFTPGARQLLKTDVRMFQQDVLYYDLIVIDLVLRISWVYKLSAEMRQMRWFVMVMTLLEVVRRWLWAFVRIENELRKIQSKQPALAPLIPYHASLMDKKSSSECEFSDDVSMTGAAQTLSSS